LTASGTPSVEGGSGLRAPEGISRLLRDLIHERTGLFFEDSRLENLLEKLEPAARRRGVQSYLEYYYILKDNDPVEWDRAWEALSVQETYFWREMAQVDALAGSLVPEWFRQRSIPFRVWSAACATGEEPFSIAMALAEAGFGSHPVEILASDASRTALEKAASGVYRERSFRCFPAALREKYFEPVPGGWRVSKEIAGRVRFKRVNLFDLGEVASVARVQAVFCRNVFIYFSRHSIRQTVATIAARMPSGGCLFVGASESLLRLTVDFELEEIAGALVYKRV
jgi:chemotaxis protein methyltransferase CheR